MSKSIRIAINGFGRIGRTLLRALERKPRNVEIVAINAPGKAELQKHILEYDSIHGKYPTPITLQGDKLCFGNHESVLLNERNVQMLPWKDLDVDVVLECTGGFRDRNSNLKHLHSGAKKVLISAPCKGSDVTVVYGVNHKEIQGEHQIISSASCTTNCLAPIAKVIDSNWGLEKAFINTVHAYTSDQVLLDRYHKDPRRGRAASLSIIPTTTGATTATEQVLPNLKGKIQGSAVRVPTANVSLLDIYAHIHKETTVEAIKKVCIDVAKGEMKGVLSVNELPLVSIDFNGHDASCIVDMTQIHLIGGNFLHLGAWYDNEWAFCQRMWDICIYMQEQSFFEQ